MAERGPKATLHRYMLHVHCTTCQECMGPLAQDLESTVAHGFVKHSFKVLLHCIIDGPLQASRYWFFKVSTNPVRLYPAVSCILGVRNGNKSIKVCRQALC